MENKDTNTDYQKFIRVGDQKWEILVFFFFFWLRFVFTIFYTGSFQVPPDKITPPKVPTPTQILIWPMSIQYKRSEKWLSFKMVILKATLFFRNSKTKEMLMMLCMN